MSAPRTFKITSPHMRGDDIKAWQREIKHEFSRMDINCPIVADGIYGVATRAYNASLCHAIGMIAGDVMSKGITPELRTRIRNRRLTAYERTRMAGRVAWRRALRVRYAGESGGGVARPVSKIIADSWGYHPGVHDGIDVICPADAPIFAMVRSTVVRVSAGGWWGKAPSGDVTKGDGIIILRVLEDVGPFKRGMHIGYGHAEKSAVKVGQEVRAGQQIGHAGLAVAWHIHMMLNGGGHPATTGRGDRDPRAILDYAIKHG
ncbi:MAG: M23 family metallopeptidase [Solirubrobacteraceae bacterium]|nr:M23 family metallopeptidase [Solirubrobacteraceae bacterium]